jgi:hypothetical protein
MMHNDDFSNVQTHDVKTKIVIVQHVISDTSLQYMIMTEKQMENEMKENLAISMAKMLLKDNLILFTKEYQPDMGHMVYRARCYLADKDVVSMVAGIK